MSTNGAFLKLGKGRQNDLEIRDLKIGYSTHYKKNNQQLPQIHSTFDQLKQQFISVELPNTTTLMSALYDPSRFQNE